MVIDFPQSESSKLRTTAHRVGRARDNVQRLTTEIALEQAMHNIYTETGCDKAQINHIRERFWRDHDMVFGGVK